MRSSILLSAAASLVLLTPAVASDLRGYSGCAADAVPSLAHRLERATRHVHRLAEATQHHGSYREERALVALHELEDAARHFHRQVERRHQNPFHTRRDFRVLERMYLRAAYSMHGLHGYPAVERGFDRVARLISELRYAFATPPGHGHRHGHGAWHNEDEHGHDDDRQDRYIRGRW